MTPVTYLLCANTYRLMSGFSEGEVPAGAEELTAQERESVGGLTGAAKVVFSSTLEDPLTWANSTLVRGDASSQLVEYRLRVLDRPPLAVSD